jgi:hypothetical protein
LEAKFTLALTTPSVCDKIDSTLEAQAAQVIPLTGNDSFFVLFLGATIVFIVMKFFMIQRSLVLHWKALWNFVVPIQDFA